MLVANANAVNIFVVVAMLREDVSQKTLLLCFETIVNKANSRPVADCSLTIVYLKKTRTITSSILTVVVQQNKGIEILKKLLKRASTWKRRIFFCYEASNQRWRIAYRWNPLFASYLPLFFSCA